MTRRFRRQLFFIHKIRQDVPNVSIVQSPRNDKTFRTSIPLWQIRKARREGGFYIIMRSVWEGFLIIMRLSVKWLKSFGHSQEAWRPAGSNNNKPLGAERVNSKSNKVSVLHLSNLESSEMK